MVHFPGFSMPGSILSLLLLQASAWWSTASEFSVKGPAEPIMVMLGADATLPCQLFPEQTAAHMHIRWYRAQLSPVVLVYQNGQAHSGEQMLEYRGRTELVADSIGRGAVALQIQQVRASDNGHYRCHFKDGLVSHEAIVELHVIGLGSVPHVSVTGPEDNGIRVLCSSEGWFPKPSVQWSDMEGVKLPTLSESHTQDTDGLFHVEASLVVTDSFLGNVTCSIQNPLSGQKKVSAIFLTGHLETNTKAELEVRMSPCCAALDGTIPLMGILIIGISFITWKEHQAKKREIKKWKVESLEKAQLKNEKERALQAKERRKAQFKSVWRNAPLYADWRKEEFENVNVTLDAATAHPSLLLTEDGRGVTFQERCQDLPNSTERFDSLPCVLGQLEISSGRYYWEVKVGEMHSWDLGICRNNVTRKGRVTVSPQNGFWAIRLFEGEYWALTSPETLLTLRIKPLRVGIFLDYEGEDVSFYNMTDGSHIFSFSHNKFHGSLQPLLRLWSSASGTLNIV